MVIIFILMGVIGVLGVFFYGISLIMDLVATGESIVAKDKLTANWHKRNVKTHLKMLGISFFIAIIGIILIYKCLY